VEAKVIISTAKEENAVLVPVSAINVDMEGEFVYVVENNILTKKTCNDGDFLRSLYSGDGRSF